MTLIEIIGNQHVRCLILEEQTRVMKASLERLLNATHAIYYAATWHPDRPLENEQKLWTELRDAAGFAPGGTDKLRERPDDGITHLDEPAVTDHEMAPVSPTAEYDSHLPPEHGGEGG